MAIDAQKKDDIFRLPSMDTLHFGRHISSVCFGGDTYAAVQVGKGRQTAILLCRFDEKGNRTFLQSPWGMAHQPCLAADEDYLHVAWNELVGDEWRIRYARLDAGAGSFPEAETVYQTAEVCQPPVVTLKQGKPYIAFTSRRQERLEIFIAFAEDRQWCTRTVFDNPDGLDRFRSALIASGSSLFVAWDQYRQPDYEVVLGEVSAAGEGKIISIMRPEKQRWLRPSITADEQGNVYLCWLALQTVTDKLGIIDNHPFVMAARCRDGKVEYLKDPGNQANPYEVGDLREGQLAGEIYKGFVGLRRNPRINLDTDGSLWLWWEMRRETWGSDVYGRLVGRKMDSRGEWSKPAIYCGDGYCYSVPPSLAESSGICVFYHFENRDFDLLQAKTFDLKAPEPLDIDTAKWRRWKDIAITPRRKPESNAEVGKESYKLVWADTHCHSNFSPDAEGELDELVNFARDMAGLDMISIIDNDFYPHKALTEVEWQLENQMAAHFSRDRHFLWLPGYEFTFHRTDLQPDFNHRCVIYPRPGGRLLRRIDPESSSDVKMQAALKEAGGMAYPHHCSYELVDPTVEWNIEACSSWRVCLEESVFTMDRLREGARIGFIGSSDTHRCVPGLAGARTGLFVEELTPEALLDAYRQRRIIATQGFNIFIDFRVGGEFIGCQGKSAGPPKISGVIREAPEEIDYVEVLRDGELLWWESPEAKDFSFDFTDETAKKGNHFYILKVKLNGDPSLNIDGDPRTNSIKPFEQNSRYPHNLARGEGVYAWTSPVRLQVE